MASAEVLSNRAPEAETISPSQLAGAYNGHDEIVTTPTYQVADPELSAEATRWAKLLRSQLSTVSTYHDSNPENSMPLPIIDEAIMQAPGRKAADPAAAALAQEIARHMYPHHNNPLGSVIQYEKDLVTLRNLVVEQRKRAIDEATERNALQDWTKRVLRQGAWDPVNDPWSLEGAPAVPMPVQIAEKETLIPFFEHLALDGTEAKDSTARAADAAKIEEPYYHVEALEFERGVLYSDRRLDLCKMVLGPTHIEQLMESLKKNAFVEHFLLGNNIVGPHGARCIANFIKEFPDRIDTWYLAGNCIDATSFTLLVDEMVKSPRVTNNRHKRNPLMPQSAGDVFRLITETPNLRTLDLDQTQLGDAGITDLFTRLAEHTRTRKAPLPLQHIYLNADGLGVQAAQAIAHFLSSPTCRLSSLYANNNPLGNEGVAALALGLKTNTSLTRLTLASVGMSDAGAIALCESLASHPTLRTLDIGQHFATQDLGARYNYLSDAAAHALTTLVATQTTTLAYLNLSYCGLSHAGLNTLLAKAQSSPSLLYLFAKTIYPQERSASAIAAGQEHARLRKAVHAALEANVRRVYGEGLSYEAFEAEEKRWLTSERTDVRKIDSVYRNRDAGLARRGEKRLEKVWGEGDETLAFVAGATGEEA